MKAVVYHGTHDVRVHDVPDPRIVDPRDAIIRVTATAICGSDLHLYDGFVATMEEGDVLGHEPMGGADVADGPDPCAALPAAAAAGGRGQKVQSLVRDYPSAAARRGPAWLSSLPRQRGWLYQGRTDTMTGRHPPMRQEPRSSHRHCRCTEPIMDAGGNAPRFGRDAAATPRAIEVVGHDGSTHRGRGSSLKSTGAPKPRRRDRAHLAALRKALEARGLRLVESTADDALLQIDRQLRLVQGGRRGPSASPRRTSRPSQR
jgi:hypothetical protein